MNLKKYFNFNYFKENIKKSKGLLAFFFGIVPILNIIALIANVSNNGGLIFFEDISLLTNIGLYIIPIVLSVSLFGFVFKQKSVDFVMAKPLSRTSIYLTNTIGGIGILILFILTNALIFGLFSLFFTSLVVPFAMIIDYIVYWLISYIFIFSITNLAITFAGNFISSMVVVALIICLIPFMKISTWLMNVNYYDNSHIVCDNNECKPETYYCYEDKECEKNLNKNKYSYYLNEKINYTLTAPLSIFSDNVTLEYNRSDSLIKMTILSITYIIIGFYTFKVRKMENNETSFKNELAHYLVKTLTFIPVCFISYMFVKEGTSIGWLVVLAIIIIYYIVYDLITRKEIYKLKKSLLVCFISFGIIVGYYALIDRVNHEIVLNTNDIDAIYSNDIAISDKSLINRIVKESIEGAYNSETHNYHMDIVIASGNKKYYKDINITSKLSSEILKIEDKEYKKQRLSFPYNKLDYMSYNDLNIPLTNKIKKLIKENKETLSNDNKDAYQVNSSVYLYSYKNYDYQMITIDLNSNEELYKYVINYNNDKSLKSLKEMESQYLNIDDDPNNTFTELDNHVFSYVINSNIESFINYLENHNKVKATQNPLVLEFYNKGSKLIVISDIKAFKNEFDDYKSRLENNAEYQRIVASFNNNTWSVYD